MAKTAGSTAILARGPDEVPRRAQRRLAAALARECRGRTALLGPLRPELARMLQERGLQLPAFEGAGSADTVLVTEALEHVEPECVAPLLERAWKRLGPEGRLVVCVPNGDCGEADESGGGRQRFTRRRLRRLLRPFGRPRLVTGQPFRWLVMVVEARKRPSPGAQERYRVIAKLCRGTVVELGCGSGDLTRTIADRGLECLGVDHSAEKIGEALRWNPGLEFREADILTWDAGGRRFGTVVLSEVLEHVEAETGLAMLDRAWELVEPGGRLVVSVPNEDCVPHPNHVRELTRKDLAQLLRRYGRPRLVTEQPFRYLLMYVNRSRAPGPPSR